MLKKLDLDPEAESAITAFFTQACVNGIPVPDIIETIKGVPILTTELINENPELEHLFRQVINDRIMTELNRLDNEPPPLMQG